MENLYMVVRREENEQDLVGSASQRKKAKKGKKRAWQKGRGVVSCTSCRERAEANEAARHGVPCKLNNEKHEQTPRTKWLKYLIELF